jgi:ribosomal protein S18 acetylase RimI-like enzyme
MIRPITPDDTPTLVGLTAETEMFKPLEIRALQEVLVDYFKETMAEGHRAFLLEEGHRTLGYVYYAPAPMADKTWYVYWIAVDRTHQGQGVGSKLVAWAEDDVRMREGRLLFIETSMLPHYEPTRRFYQKRGYELAARLQDWYAEGDDMVVFRKRLNGLDATSR